MKFHHRLQYQLFSMLILAACTSAHSANAPDTVESLQHIISQSSEIPELLTARPPGLPDSLEDKQRPVSQNTQLQNDPLKKRLSNPVTEEVLKKKLSKMQNALDQQSTIVQSLTTQLSKANQTITDLKGDHANKNIHEGLKRERDNQKVLTNDLTVKLATANNTISELKKDKLNNDQLVDESKNASLNLEKMNRELKSKITELTAVNIDTSIELARAEAVENNTIAQYKNELKRNQEHSQKLEKDIIELKKLNENHEKSYAELKSTSIVPPPGNVDETKAYSLGAHWGQEIVETMAQLESSHVKIDVKQVSSGVSDAINNALKISHKKIDETLADLTQKAQGDVQEANKEASRKEGDLFIETFARKRGVKKSDKGYYYLIQTQGTGVIKDSDIVEVTVKESLTNGKVIKDMAVSGRTLTLPLDKFPPLFSSAIGLIGNKGSIKLVVPPEHAYGEQGRPPEIPPSSTMVYEVVVKAHQK